ncbi:lantibiotic dehydratase [Kutzneria kofuensis]|uniref:Lantibiotic dehydratase N-terminal domain-containing protein n=1 Tax=Kutzneria kofuensis TaxID=103725 RepID=A0A7W9KPK6_9PSEU|nr:lantibiotic dehydratase [Kutzneria kofuensis]MBB5896372.1 hypothetical protein [Kutzneria kofuensis]
MTAIIDVKPEAAGHLVDLTEGWSLWRQAVLRSAGMPFEWLSCLSDETLSARDRIARLLGHERFLEALTWQSPAVVANWVGDYLATGRLARAGQREALLARYAQRYCAKNDTIGFFGPVAWAELDEAGDPLELHGTVETRRHSVHLESWAVALVANSWPREQQPVRVHPAVSWRDSWAWRPRRRPHQLSPLAAELLARARDQSLRALVAEVTAGTGVEPASVAAEIDRLVEADVLVVGYRVPLDGEPERHLRADVSRVADEPDRQGMLATLDRLSGLRERLGETVGRPAEVYEALTELTAGVASASGLDRVDAARSGQGGRAVAYLDSRRDLDVVIGGELIDKLREPLGIALDAARWLAAEVGDAVEELLWQRYTELAASADPVRLCDLQFAAADVLSGAPGTVVHDVAEDFLLRWKEILAAGEHTDDGREIRLDLAAVAPLAAVLFPRREPRWQAARCHSPDLMLDHHGGTWRWVLGELHVGLNTMENRVFHNQADDPARLAAAVAADMSAGRMVALQPWNSPEVSSRTYPPLAVHVPDRYVYWSFGNDVGSPAGAALPGTELLVMADGDRLAVRPERGGWQASLLEAFGEFLSALVADRFAILAADQHQPRVCLGDLVLRRESWTIAAADIVACAGPGRLRARLTELGVPVHFFARTPAERKPFYVDMRSTALLANVTRAARLCEGAQVVMSEMLPGPEGLWLRDDAGNGHTAEFRVVAVDEAAAPPVVFERDGGR